MLWRKPVARTWYFTLLFILGLSLIFYFFLVRGANSNVTQLLVTRKQTIARAQASNLTSFFQTFGNSIAVFAQLSSMQHLGSDTLHDMEIFIDQWRDGSLVGGIVLTDDQGRVQLNANVLGTSDVGASLADRDYFPWAKQEPRPGQYFVGHPVISRLGASKGQVIVPVAAAVYHNDVFVGALTASIKLHSLTQRYLELMKVSSVNTVYLVDSQNEIVYNSALPEEIGTPASDLFPELHSAFNTTQEGQFKSGQHIVAYTPVPLGQQNWLLLVVAPFTQITDITTPIYLRLMAVLILVSLTILLFGAIATRTKPPQNTLS